MTEPAKHDPMRVWNALMRTDPAHTKGFNRSGGFKGTAVKPIYCSEKMTALFGPCGIGWGIDEPRFQVVPAGEEILVYCWVQIWVIDPTSGEVSKGIWGTGGDKVVTKRDKGPFADDEAFKKSFTDAIGNAMKQLGMSADVHMGMFDDSKYVARVTADIAAEEKAGAPKAGQYEIPDQSTWEEWIAMLAGRLKTAPTRDEVRGLIADNVKKIETLAALDEVGAKTKKKLLATADARIAALLAEPNAIAA